VFVYSFAYENRLKPFFYGCKRIGGDQWAPISVDPFALVKKEFGSLYSGFKGRGIRVSLDLLLEIFYVPWFNDHHDL
jgi:hypothetical protein